MKFYTLQYLLSRLKQEGLPAGRRTIVGLEGVGIVPRPKNTLFYRLKPSPLAGETRIYTKEEVEEIVEKVREYKKKRYATQK